MDILLRTSEQAEQIIQKERNPSISTWIKNKKSGVKIYQFK
jgi:hypothetical protein